MLSERCLFSFKQHCVCVARSDLPCYAQLVSLVCMQMQEALQAASWQEATRWDELVGFLPLPEELLGSLHQEVSALREAWKVVET